MKEKYSKIIEVSMSVAAADGISPNELMASLGTITSVPAVLEAIQYALEKNDLDFEKEEFDLLAWTEALTASISDDIETDSPEMIDLNDAYLAEASVIIGHGFLLNNLCVGLAIYFCAQDGISTPEAEAIRKVSKGLVNVDGKVALMMANTMQQVLASVEDDG